MTARAATGSAEFGTADSVRRSHTARPTPTVARTAVWSKISIPSLPSAVRPALLLIAAVLVGAAIFLPLWGMMLVSIQYPEGLRMIVYPTRMVGDLAEINALNHYIGMAEISPDYFGELRVIVAAFAGIAGLCGIAAFVRRRWAAIVPLGLMVATGIYGFWRMRTRLYQYGHDLDPMAAIDIEPFTPPMLGENVIAQFGTYSWFSWGTFLPIIAGLLVATVVFFDVRRRWKTT